MTPGVVLLWLLSFALFVLIQGVAINGLYESFSDGQIFHKMAPKFIDKNRGKWWTKPLYSCTKCMASVWGTVLFWSAVIPIFGFAYYELLVWVIDIFVLVVVNFQIYKRS
jgi:hypothetical protein